jgi:RNA polymerase sigma-70 factor (ECF subfamily)
MENKEFKIGLCAQADKCIKKTDEELVVLVKKNSECFGCLISRYEDKIIRYIRRISAVNEETAEDIAQDIFLKVYMNLNQFDPKLKFSSWVYRIAHNETINHWRRNKKGKQEDVSWDQHESLKNIIKDGLNVEQRVYQKITNEDVMVVVNDLEEKYREVIILSYIEGKNYQEIADILNKPLGTIGTLINRGKKILAKKLEESGVDKSIAINSN